jgi:hypothetical protein
MRRVEWWVAKVFGKDIDLWEQFETRGEASKYVKRNNSNSPACFSLVKLTMETIGTKRKVKS